jgi:hypothetical protein
MITDFAAACPRPTFTCGSRRSPHAISHGRTSSSLAKRGISLHFFGFSTALYCQCRENSAPGNLRTGPPAVWPCLPHRMASQTRTFRSRTGPLTPIARRAGDTRSRINRFLPAHAHRHAPRPAVASHNPQTKSHSTSLRMRAVCAAQPIASARRRIFHNSRTGVRSRPRTTSGRSCLGSRASAAGTTGRKNPAPRIRSS